MKRLTLLLLLGTILPGLVACVGTQSFSNSARSGDTVAVAIGEAAGAQYINPADVSAVVIDSTQNQFPVKVRAVVRVYADPLSIAAIGGFNSPSYEGEWMALIDLVDPNTDVAPAMATGSATLQLTDSNQNIDLYDPALTIIPGTGTPHSLLGTNNFPPLDAGYLNSQPHIAIQTSGASATAPAGATFTLLFNSSTISTPSSIRITKLSQDPNVQLSFSKQDLGNGVIEFNVIILNPHGFDAGSGDDLIAGKSYQKDLSFVLGWDNTNTTLPSTASDIILVSSNYIDTNGDAITTGLMASMGGGFGYTQN